MEDSELLVILGTDLDFECTDSNTLFFTVKSDKQFLEMFDIAKRNKMYLTVDFTEGE